MLSRTFYAVDAVVAAAAQGAEDITVAGEDFPEGEGPHINVVVIDGQWDHVSEYASSAQARFHCINQFIMMDDG